MKHFVLICDDNYALPTIVTIKSIVDKADKKQSYCVHVCCVDLKKENIEMIESLGGLNSIVCVDRIPPSYLERATKSISQKTHVSISALIKFELPNIYADIDKILYLDSDIIVKSNLVELFSIDLKDNYLAASFELWKYINTFYYCFGKVDGIDFFFNSGVMLMNLKKMREDGISEQLWFYKLNSAKTKLMDQESFNAVCKEKVLPLSIIYNCNPIFIHEKYMNCVNKVYGCNYTKPSDLMDDVKIIHYVGKSDKPWIYINGRCQRLWMSYYNRIKGIKPITLKPYVGEKQSLLSKIKSHFQYNGFKGLISYLFYRRKRI